jgi:hypothetical protein
MVELNKKKGNRGDLEILEARASSRSRLRNLHMNVKRRGGGAPVPCRLVSAPIHHHDVIPSEQLKLSLLSS